MHIEGPIERMRTPPLAVMCRAVGVVLLPDSAADNDPRLLISKTCRVRPQADGCRSCRVGRPSRSEQRSRQPSMFWRTGGRASPSAVARRSSAACGDGGMARAKRVPKLVLGTLNGNHTKTVSELK